MSTHNRPARVAEEFRQELSSIITRGLKDPRITGFVTVTGAKMPPDLKEVTVYVSIHGDDDVRARTFEGLKAAATFLQREVARKIGLRNTPHLRFVYDESVARGDRIDRLLREAKVKDQAGPDSQGAPGAPSPSALLRADGAPPHPDSQGAPGAPSPSALLRADGAPPHPGDEEQ